jgi:two-component system sensor histidine kinase BaeS
MRVRRFVSSLTGRIVLVTLGVSLIAVLVTAVISIGVIQRLAIDQARQQLKSQTQVLAEQPTAGDLALARQAQRLTGDGDRFAIVGPRGRLVGAAAPYVGPKLVIALLEGRDVSTTAQVNGETVVVEGLPRVSGGGVVGIRKVADIKAANAVLIRWILVAVAAGFLAAVIAGTLLARLIGEPLVQLAAAARRLARGERRVEVEHQRIPEIEDISQSLRTLDAALASSEDRQREFLLSVSHEIRTPLTAIRGYAEAMADGVIAPGDIETVGNTLTTEAARLGKFVDDLLELARLESDDFAISLGPVEVNAMLLRAADAWSGLCAQLGVQLRTEIPSTPIVLLSDDMRLRQVVDGLIENALRVTPVGKPVVLAARFGDPGAGVGHLLSIEVRDGGPGLTADDASVAFERGVLNARYRDSRPVGSGLGLSIAHRLVTRLGGRITAGSAPEGGACFRVDFALQNPNIEGTVI